MVDVCTGVGAAAACGADWGGVVCVVAMLLQRTRRMLCDGTSGSCECSPRDEAGGAGVWPSAAGLHLQLLQGENVVRGRQRALPPACARRPALPADGGAAWRCPRAVLGCCWSGCSIVQDDCWRRPRAVLGCCWRGRRLVCGAGRGGQLRLHTHADVVRGRKPHALSSGCRRLSRHRGRPRLRRARCACRRLQGAGVGVRCACCPCCSAGSGPCCSIPSFR